MRRTLLSLSIAAAVSLPVLVQANPLTDQGGDQTVSGDQTYTQVQATNGHTLTFTNGSIKVDNSANTTVNAPAVHVSGGSTINFGSTESKLGIVSVLANPNKVGQDYPYWTTLVQGGVLNVYAQKYEQKNSGHGVYVVGQANNQDVSSTLNLFVDEFESTSAYGALHVRQGEGAVINVGTKDQWLTSFKATRTVEASGVSLLQANEGGTINIFSKYVELNAFDTHVGGGAIGTGAWGTVNITADELKIKGSINGDYGGYSASNADSVYKVNINVGKLTMDGGIYAGVTGNKADISTGTARKEIINITATDASSSITGDIEATNRSETNITFVNGGTFTGDIVSKNITNEEDSEHIKTVSKISLNGQMTYKGDATLVGASALTLSGDIDGSESTVNSSEESAVSVEGSISLGTVTSTSSEGVNITDGSLLTLSNGESSISKLNSDGDLYLSETATAKLNTVTGNATITVDSVANTAAITNVASGSAVTARATAHFNDASASASDALASLLETVTVGDGSSLSEAVVEEGDVNNKVTATIEDGKVVSQTETKNSKLDAFNSIATLSAFQWRHEMNDLTKRMGELRDSEGTIGAWARVYGSELQYGDQNVKQKSNSIQVGSDFEVAPGFKVGAAFNYTNGSAEYNNGDADNNAYGLGIYGTWMAENGMFLDVIAKYVRLDTDFSLNGFDGSFDNNAYSLSAEFGWRFDLNDLAFVEPQVELSYGRVAGDTFTAANGVTVKQDDFDTLIGRAGVRAGFKFPENKGNIYAKFSVAHDFQGEMDAVATNGTALNTMHSDIGGTWVEYGVGGNFRLCKNAYGYVDLERTSGAEVNANYRWNIGLRTFF
ncbi:autotransporter outer membrane beta-barrel domain-containing protein [Sutterella wadsworthensis]|uniref:autotransporter outer membrane beta-barrel domain-containing protein n=1 Tax=Sutterella wadsworthensis TaxID=40545 RepID=UPI0013F640D1|nr:autotransporter outer membrane beta-barrel domain-containing protein [Sutterella wadsworthensis]